MKFSDELRLADEIGLPDLRQAFVMVDTREWGGEKPPCCAIGGANIASGRVRIVPDENGHVPNAQCLAANKRPQLHHTSDVAHDWTYCPVCRYDEPYSALVIHLYDNHLWSRTQIADWLDAEGVV